jgi:hypothetical protein
MDEKSNNEEGLTLDKGTLDVLVANIIPTSRYFEVRFDHMQSQIDGINNNIKDFRGDVDKRFDEAKVDVDKRFEQVDKRFDETKADFNKRFDEAKVDVDKRFEQVDKRFEQMIASIDRLGDKLEYRDEKQRFFTLRMFTIAIGISILGALGAFLKSLGVL